MKRLWLILLLVATAAPSWAAESAPVQSARLTATLVADTDAVEAGHPFQVALRLRMAPGWHTYWQNPGDAGSPPEVALALPQGTSAGDMQWPAPQRLPEGPVMTYAYTGEVVLPITVMPGQGAQTITAKADWLVCERICVPEEGSFTLNLPAGQAAPSAQSPLFAASEARVPRPSPFAARIAPDGTLSLSGEGLSRATVQDAWFFPSAWGPVDQAAPQKVMVQDGVVRIGLTKGSAFAPNAALPGLVVLRDPKGEESFLSVQAMPGPAVADRSTPLARTLLLAFLGGLLLNLMPCVFPVLAMKAMGLARISGQVRREAAIHAAAYTGGVLLAFAALGGALLAARATGDAAGWGFQFQSPVFVAAMAWLLFLVGLNLSGVFEVGTRLAGAGQGLAARGGAMGSFFTGLLAVLVATPCTAPFMGAAIAGAVAATASVTVLVFVAMGIGMALPYLLLGLFPAWARVLPRPGKWMDVLRGVLAFPMYGAAVWLVWVLSLQAGSSGVLAGLAGMVVLGFGAWAFGLAQHGGRWQRAGQAVALACVAAAAALLVGVGAAPDAPASAKEAGVESFTPARLAALRAEGRPVFVNMTAAWCVTCLVNERIALSREPVQRAFADHRVAYLKGDWTRGDPAITDFLRANARDGVPLYVFYPPGQAAPVVLPQILTEAEVLSQLDKPGG